ncbi:MAG: helix-turn-helix domain-containing protein [Proteobacteria bacterium]|nr:helix-turn-helix domain-containing protein [Pseudomonadota bacterium]
MAKIDGGEIRKLREAKGLTQLYLATFIGVTTDTVSRWENRRYPAMKMENAEKLAEALEVELDAILDLEQGDDSVVTPQDGEVESLSQGDQDNKSIQPVGSDVLSRSHWRSFMPWLLVISACVAFGGIYLMFIKPVPPVAPPVSVVVERILPKHIPAGQIFPVLIRVSTSQQSSVSLIVRESIPSGCRVLNSEPSFVSADVESGVLKWISRTDKQEAIFAYLVKAPVKSIDGGQLIFSGGVTINQGDQVQVDIIGDDGLVIAPYHWADIDQNNMIDDEEILAVYDRYSVLVQLDFDRDLIDSIWTGDGYMWDKRTERYVVQKYKR